jgi:hypothetical protein
MMNLELCFTVFNHVNSRYDSLGGGLAHREATQTQKKRGQTFIPRVRFEPMTPVFERAKTIQLMQTFNCNYVYQFYVKVMLPPQ